MVQLLAFLGRFRLQKPLQGILSFDCQIVIHPITHIHIYTYIKKKKEKERWNETEWEKKQRLLCVLFPIFVAAIELSAIYERSVEMQKKKWKKAREKHTHYINNKKKNIVYFFALLFILFLTLSFSFAFILIFGDFPTQIKSFAPHNYEMRFSI